jgi:3-isopropylmalate/(R)-2-methylmalate dehydratase large subunit
MPIALLMTKVDIDASQIQPTVTWGITPGQGVGIEQSIPAISDAPTQSERDSVAEASEYMQFEGGSPIKGKKIDVAFIGSCTNGRLSDFQEVAKYVKGIKSPRACKPSSFLDRKSWLRSPRPRLG